MTTGRFAAATAVTLVGDGTYTAAVLPGWDIAGNANGGYLLAIGARALLDATGRPDPVTVTGHFLSPGSPGPVTVTTDVVKEGKRFTTARATLHATDRPLLTMLGTFGDLGENHGALLVDGSPPDLPPVDGCVHIVATDTFPPPFMGKVELHLHPDDVGFADGGRSGIARVRGWFQLPDGETSTPSHCSVPSTHSHPPSSTPTYRWPGHRPWSSRVTFGPGRRPARSAASSPPGSSPAASSRRTARSGTPTGGWSLSHVSWPSCPGDRRPSAKVQRPLLRPGGQTD